MKADKIRCKYCNNEYSKKGIARHERLCKENPNRDLNLLACMRRNGTNTCKLLHKRVHEEKLKDNATRQKREFICKKCGRKYFLYLTDKELLKGKFRKHCSRACANSHTVSEETKKKISLGSRRNKEYSCHYKERICKICGNIFTSAISKYKNYCSLKCKEEYLVKYKTNISEETRKKLSAAGRKSAMKRSEEKRSKNEKYFCSLCENYFEHVEHNMPIFNNWDADIIIHDIKVAVLWNGPWHYRKITKAHSVLQVQNRDKLKIKEIEKAGYMPYIIKDDGKSNQKFVENEFQKFLNNFNL